MKLVSGGYSDLLGTLATGGNVLLALRNGRAFERDADATGVQLLEKLEVRADGVASFFEQMLAKEPKELGRRRRHLVEPSADHRAHRRHAAAVVRHAGLHRCRVEGGAQCLQVTARRCRCAGRSRTTSGW